MNLLVEISSARFIIIILIKMVPRRITKLENVKIMFARYRTEQRIDFWWSKNKYSKACTNSSSTTCSFGSRIQISTKINMKLMDKRQPRKLFVVDHKTGRMARLNMSKKLADPPIIRNTISVIDTISFINGLGSRAEYLFFKRKKK